MPLSLPQLQTRSTRFQQEFAASLGDVLGATAEQAFSELPIPSLARTFSLARANAAIQRLDAAIARQRVKDAGLEGRLTIDDAGIAAPALDILIERKREEVQRQEVLARAPDGFGTSAARLGTAFATSLLDPLNVGLAFVPVLGEARYLQYLARARGVLGRSAVRAGVGAVEGAAGAAIVEPLVLAAKTQEQADYGFQDSLLNVAFGTVFGGGLHSTVGAGRELAENLTVYQPLSRASRDSLRQAYYAAEANKERFDDLAREVAKEVGGEAQLPRLKGKKRAVEKVATDYDGDAVQLRDIVRGTIVVDSIDTAQRALVAAGRRFGGIEGVRNTIRPEAGPSAPDGYRDIKTNVKIAGRTYELQINTREMIEAKDKAHALYEKARALEGSPTKPPTPEQEAELLKLRDQQRAIYDAAWEAILRKSASDTTEPLRMYDEAGNQRPSGTSQARTLNSGSQLTGTPSTSANSVPGGNISGSMNTSSEIIAQNASPRVREAALRTAVGQLTEGREVAVDPLFTGDTRAAAVTSQRQMLPESDITADVRAARTADEQLAEAKPAEDPIADVEQQIAELTAELKDVSRVAGVDLTEELADLDELVANAATYGKAARAAALCGLGH